MATKTDTSKPTLMLVDPRAIVVNKQVRTERNEKADKEFYASVKRDGAIFQPVQARMVKGKLHLVAGHRRTEAAVLAEFPTIPVYVSDVPDSDVVRRQLIENIQREGLSLLDTARGVKHIHQQMGGVVTKTAEALGKSNGWTSKMLIVSGEDKANPGTATIAQKLLAADKIGDLESAYYMTKLEELNPVAAQEVADNIENETRASIKRKLEKAKPMKTAKKDETTEDEDQTPMWRWILKIVEAASVSRKDAPLQAAAVAMIKDQLGESEEEAPM